MENITANGSESLEKKIELLSKGQSYDINAPIKSHRPVFGPFITVLKKILRPFLFGSMSGILDRQEEFNREVVQYANAAREANDNIREAVERLDSRMKPLMEKLGDMEVKVESYMAILSRRIALLEQRLEGRKSGEDRNAGPSDPPNL